MLEHVQRGDGIDAFVAEGQPCRLGLHHRGGVGAHRLTRAHTRCGGSSTGTGGTQRTFLVGCNECWSSVAVARGSRRQRSASATSRGCRSSSWISTSGGRGWHRRHRRRGHRCNGSWPLPIGGSWTGIWGPYDEPRARLGRADTVVILDFSLACCAWRAARRSPERADFWWWLLTWRRRPRAALLDAVATFAAGADVHILRTPGELCRLLSPPVGRSYGARVDSG